jgi:predicted glycosyltransferase
MKKYRFLIDINHPAHVHFFKNLILEFKRLGHEVIITAIDKDITISLLEEYGFTYLLAGRYGKKTIEKIALIPYNDFMMYKIAFQARPDALLGLASYKIGHAGRLLGKKVFVFDDTEHSTGEIMLYSPFATAVFTPECFGADLGKKQVRYAGYHELAYLHPNRYQPSPALLHGLGLSENSVFSIVRFVSWQASHDRGVHGLTDGTKIAAIKAMDAFGPVFITSEKKLPPDLEKYRLAIKPSQVHDLMAYASLVYGESATMSSEAAILGVHSIFCDVCGRGYTDEEERRYGLVSNFRLDAESQSRSVAKISELLSLPDLKSLGQRKRQKLLAEKIDVTGFILKDLLSRMEQA